MKVNVCLLSCVLVGCANQVQLEPSSQLDGLEELSVPNVHVLPLPKLPELKYIELSTEDEHGEELATLDNDGMEQLRVFKETARANTLMAQKLLENQALSVEYANNALRLAKLQEQRANVLGEQYKNAENQRRAEEVEHEFELIFYRLLLIIGVAVGL